MVENKTSNSSAQPKTNFVTKSKQLNPIFVFLPLHIIAFQKEGCHQISIVKHSHECFVKFNINIFGSSDLIVLK